MESSGYLCSSSFSDNIFRHSMASLKSSGTLPCPTNAIGERIGAHGHLVFPLSNQKCAVTIGAKCGAPSFRVNDASKAKSKYELYWAEWDYSMLP